MEDRDFVRHWRCAVFVMLGLGLAAQMGLRAENDKLLTGKAAMGDWTGDAPGVHRKITVDDLPPPGSNALAINPPRVVDRPSGAELHGPPEFKIDIFASRFRDPRFLLTAPNGDIFVSEGRANQIKIIRGEHAESVQVFAEGGLNKPFGLAFYPPGNDPQFLYVANTDGVIRLPYRNGDLKARGPAEKLAAKLSAGAGFLRSGGHWTRDIVFSPDGKKCMCRSARAPTIRMMRGKRIWRAFSNSILTEPNGRFSRGEFGMRSVSPFARGQMSFG
jgi:glucose/arabinose dehydrogenase